MAGDVWNFPDGGEELSPSVPRPGVSDGEGEDFFIDTGPSDEDEEDFEEGRPTPHPDRDGERAGFLAGSVSNVIDGVDEPVD